MPALNQDQIDEMIIGCYQAATKEKGSVKRLMYDTGLTHNQIYKRGLQLGCISRTRQTQTPWSREENQILEDNAHVHPLIIARYLKKAGFCNRTPIAIQVQMTRQGINRTEERTATGVYSSTQAAKLLGVNNHTIVRYINIGALKAVRDPGYGDKRYKITDKALCALLVNHVDMINFSRIDKFWLAEQIRKA